MIGQLQLTKNSYSQNISDKTGSKSNLQLWNVGAAVGLIGGLSFLFGTVFLNISEFFYGEKEHGVGLFLAALFLLMFGAHCLDKIGDIKRAKKIAYLEMHATRFEKN